MIAQEQIVGITLPDGGHTSHQHHPVGPQAGAEPVWFGAICSLFSALELAQAGIALGEANDPDGASTLLAGKTIGMLNT